VWFVQSGLAGCALLLVVHGSRAQQAIVWICIAEGSVTRHNSERIDVPAELVSHISQQTPRRCVWLLYLVADYGSA
jgi:hypothetical protein